MTSSKKSGTPLMRQYDEVKQQYPDSILLFRMGDFYETFKEDAKTTAKILGIVLTKRANGAAADVPLAGFPYHALDNYLPKLVKAGHRVAICEQVEDPKLAKGIVKREVVEVVTPGTIASDQALNEKTNQFLAALVFQKDSVGFSLLDASTGEFLVGESSVDQLTEILRKYAPREVLIDENITVSDREWYIALKPFLTKIESWMIDESESRRQFLEHFKVKSLKGFGCEDLPLGITAGGMIFHHVKNNLNGNLDHISTVRPILEEGIMVLDAFTVRNLEIFKSLATQGTHGTLLEVMDETETAGGGRLLRQWLNRPLTDLKQINARLEGISGFRAHNSVLKSVKAELGEFTDIERTLGKISRRKAGPRDIIGLKQSLERIPVLQDQLNSSKQEVLKKISALFQNPEAVTGVIQKTLKSEPSSQLSQGGVIKSGVDKELDELRDLASSGKQWIADLQKSERERTGIQSLKVGFNKVFGYYLEVTKANQDQVPEDYIRKQTLVNSERYVTPELKEYEEKVLTAEERILEIETRIFDDLYTEILSHAAMIQKNAALVNRLDVLSTFAGLAIKHNYCRPDLVNDRIFNLKGFRHPVVERLLPATERFIPNDLKMDCKTSQIHLITGPNMAGKSTFLRQTGLVVLMAQIGSFVPAESARIGIVDRLFTRVGASDNLAGGESTFLVEMNEAANILNNATESSLILLDEIGRGTATFDGLSLAWAITEFLHSHPEVAARSLFATHYHELTDLEHTLDRLENHHAAVKEFGDKIVFLKKILPGPGDKSYGIHVAQMAGLPVEVIRRATEILAHHIHSQQESGTGQPLEASKQVSLFEERESELKKEVSALDVDRLTPLEALEKLDSLKKKYGL